MDDELHVQFYSHRPLTLRNFELPGDPYDGDADTLELLKRWGVVFYRDQDHTEGIIIEPDSSVLTPICDQSGWGGFKSMVVLDPDVLSVLEWELMRPGRAAYISKHGDALQWLMWNQPVVVKAMKPGSVQLV